MKPTSSFGTWLRWRRRALDLTQDQLAHQAGCAIGTIKKIETDERRPSRQLAERLADYLEIPTAERTDFLKAARAELATDRLAITAPALSQPIASTTLPSGTVTFLFTDIEGSTKLWEQHPQAMPAALAQHHALLRAAIQAQAGVVFQIIGDAFCAAFPTAPAALRAALLAQRALRDAAWGPTGRIRVRMAVHTAAVALQGGDYPSGPHFNRLARLLNAGHGGQVLLSAATHELLREQLPVDAALHDLGAHQLKDLSRPEQIFQLVTSDLSAEFPPLRTLDPRRSNLPAQPTALIGREREIVDLCALLRRNPDEGRGPDVRLLTLIGPGGTGKTRLGLQVAAELLDTFADGVYFVDLAPISDPALVEATIAQTLSVPEIAGQPLLASLKAYLRAKHTLLLLDNFEQVVDAAPLAAELLAACPHLKVMVTSRVPLHLRGEKEIPVTPLALPPPTDPSTPLRAGDRRPATDHRHDEVVNGRSSVVTQYAAVQLFIARALDVQPTFVVTNDNAPSVAEICHRLDGLPLALELAAARIKLFAPEALLARLGTRLRLLTGGARDLPLRQQTLRHTIDWSYELLSPAEQTLFRELGVFVGGWTLEAAEAVCNTGGDLAIDVMDGVVSLLDKNLLRQVESGEPRFVMLETIREYALERLETVGEIDAVRRAHATYYLALAEAAEPELRGPRQLDWLERLEAEHDNLRAALAWTLDGGDRAVGVRFVEALWWFWYLRGYWSEGRGWLAGARAHTLSPARLLLGVGFLAFQV